MVWLVTEEIIFNTEASGRKRTLYYIEENNIKSKSKFRMELSRLYFAVTQSLLIIGTPLPPDGRSAKRGK